MTYATVWASDSEICARARKTTIRTKASDIEVVLQGLSDPRRSACLGMRGLSSFLECRTASASAHHNTQPRYIQDEVSNEINSCRATHLSADSIGMGEALSVICENVIKSNILIFSPGLPGFHADTYCILDSGAEHDLTLEMQVCRWASL